MVATLHAPCRSTVPIVSCVGVVDDYFESLDADTRKHSNASGAWRWTSCPTPSRAPATGWRRSGTSRNPTRFAAAKRHLSVFPFSPQVVDEVRDRLSGYELSKGTIRFTVDKPLADDVIRDVVMLRMTEILVEDTIAARSRTRYQPDSSVTT